jgi:hypothetical protein
MRRLFWLGVGAAVGVLVVRRASRAAQSFTPQGMAAGLAASIGELGDAVRDFAREVRAGMAEREAEILAALAAEGTPLGGEPEAAGPGSR